MKYRTLIALHVAALLVAACALKEAIAADCLPNSTLQGMTA